MAERKKRVRSKTPRRKKPLKKKTRKTQKKTKTKTKVGKVVKSIVHYGRSPLDYCLSLIHVRLQDYTSYVQYANAFVLIWYALLNFGVFGDANNFLYGTTTKTAVCKTVNHWTGFHMLSFAAVSIFFTRRVHTLDREENSQEIMFYRSIVWFGMLLFNTAIGHSTNGGILKYEVYVTQLVVFFFMMILNRLGCSKFHLRALGIMEREEHLPEGRQHHPNFKYFLCALNFMGFIFFALCPDSFFLGRGIPDKICHANLNGNAVLFLISILDIIAVYRALPSIQIKYRKLIIVLQILLMLHAFSTKDLLDKRNEVSFASIILKCLLVIGVAYHYG